MQWEDSGSGPGHMQRVSINLEGQAQDAYRAWMTHAADCTQCAHEAGRRCADGESLWQAYRAART